MNEQFFDQKDFLNLCKANRIEPMITGDNKLVLVCPKHPGKDVEDKFKAMIPAEVPWAFAEGLSQVTISRIKAGLNGIGIVKVIVQMLPGHRVVLDIYPPSGHPLAGSTSPIWDLVAGMLQKDSFVQTFAIRVDGQMVRNSEQYVGSPELPIDDEGDHYMEHDHNNLPGAEPKRTPVISVKDDRFAYDRPYLPEDVEIDVKILLESTGSVEEFLKNI